jgi:hypothetical protein
MNFFFGIKTNFLRSQLQIPKFRNRDVKFSKKINLYSANIKEGIWNLKDLGGIIQDDHFYYLASNEINNDTIFFLATNKEILKFEKKKLAYLSDFTVSYPSFRCNFEICNNFGGFSSFQSEYPFSMINKSGNIFSPINSLLNIDAERNFLFFKNIIAEPKKIKFNAHFVNLKTKKIVKTFECFTNFSNLISVDKKFIRPDIYFVSNQFLGIPMYISMKNNHLSIEHTHPPHEYIQSPNRFEIISKIKKQINEIFN